MREIKFRVWNTTKKKMSESFTLSEFASDQDYETGEGCFTLQNADEPHNEYPLMQFTGVHDKNGKEIYEGDRVKNERGEIGEIVFNRGAFVSKYSGQYNWDPLEPCDGLLFRQEVIGNIYEEAANHD